MLIRSKYRTDLVALCHALGREKDNLNVCPFSEICVQTARTRTALPRVSQRGKESKKRDTCVRGGRGGGGVGKEKRVCVVLGGSLGIFLSPE